METGTAILRAVTYADLFDYPMTVCEIVRYLERPLSASLVEAALEKDRLLLHRLARTDEFISLAGRESISAVRRKRKLLAERMWPDAIRFGQLIARLPFVRMVAVTGSLAMDNPTDSADIDYLIITETDRLWTCRAFVISIVRIAASRGVRLCPNYFLAQNQLSLEDHTLYTAREVAQMIPLAGIEVYRQFREQNGWVDRMLPNAAGPPVKRVFGSGGTFPRAAAEWMLSGAVGNRLEKWEMGRKIRKLQRLAKEDSEISFSAGQCKGHFDAHHILTMEQFGMSSAAQEMGHSLQ